MDAENDAAAQGVTPGGGGKHDASASQDDAKANIGESPSTENGDIAESLEFLRRHAGGGEVQLHSIHRDGGAPRSHAFSTGDGRAAWIERHNRDGGNIYFTTNRLTASAPRNKKPEKSDIEAGTHGHVDCDPIGDETPEAAKARALAKLEMFPVKPAEVNDSGGGVQMFWAFDEACTDHERIENVNRRLAAYFGGDHCHNIDRIMRVPGTINWPNAKKQAKGRVPSVATIVVADGPRCNLAALEAALPPLESSQARPDEPHTIPDDLPPITSLDDIAALAGIDKESLRHLIVKGHRPNFKPAYKSRSEALFAAVLGMLRAGADLATTCSVIMDGRFAIAASVLEKRRGARAYAERQIQKALAKLAATETAAADPGQFIRDENGQIVATSQENIRLAVEKLGVRLRYDTFADRMPIEGLDGFDTLNDTAINRLWLDIDAKFRFRPVFDFFYRVVTDAARRASFHPVHDYLDRCQDECDGQPRIDTWLIRHGGAADTPYTRAVSRLALIAAVRRIRHPAAKFDEMLVLESPKQGTDKSSGIAALSPREEWFSDDLPLNCDSQEVIERTAGKWIIEAAELSGMKRITDIERLKSFMSRRVDRARAAYARVPEERRRSFVVFGTTNESKYLKDTSGNRRFWPVLVVQLNVAAIIEERDQLWGEAAAAEAAGASIRLDKALWSAAGEEQEERRADDPWEDRLREVFGGVVGKVRVDDAYKVVGKFAIAHRTQHDQERLGAAMKLLGWSHARLHFNKVKTGCYVKGEHDYERGQKIVVEDVTNEFGDKIGVRATYE